MRVAERLHKWLTLRYGSDHGWRVRAAGALGISPQHLSKYLNGVSAPGNKMQARLRELGCDIEWLMTGERVDIRERPVLGYQVNGVPLLGKIVASPDGKQYFEESEDPLSVPYFKGNYFALIIENDSLINAPDGDHSMELYPPAMSASSRHPASPEMETSSPWSSNSPAAGW